MTPNRKQTMLILFFAFVASKGIFRLLVFLITQNPRRQAPPPDPSSYRVMIYTLAAGALLACVGHCILVTRRSVTAQTFQTNVILDLAFSNAATIFGLMFFLLGAKPAEFNIFVIVPIAVDLLVILPSIVKRI